MSTIHSLVKKYKNKVPGRLMIQSNAADSTYFIPWFFDNKEKEWHGEIRWYGRNNKEIKYGKRHDTYLNWRFVKIIPILPKSHRTRIFLEYLMSKTK